MKDLTRSAFLPLSLTTLSGLTTTIFDALKLAIHLPFPLALADHQATHREHTLLVVASLYALSSGWVIVQETPR